MYRARRRKRNLEDEISVDLVPQSCLVGSQSSLYSGSLPIPPALETSSRQPAALRHDDFGPRQLSVVAILCFPSLPRENQAFFLLRSKGLVFQAKWPVFENTSVRKRTCSRRLRLTSFWRTASLTYQHRIGAPTAGERAEETTHPEYAISAGSKRLAYASSDNL